MPSGTISAFANSYAADGALTGWTNPENAYSDNGTCATRSADSKNAWYGNLFGFDLSSLDANATVVSATLTAEWNNSSADSSGPEFFLSAYHAGTLIGSGTTDTSGQVAPETATYTPTVTATMLRATGGTSTGFYGVARFRRTDNTAHVGSLDYLKIAVIYNLVYNVTPAQNSQAQTMGEPALTKIDAATPAQNSQAQTVGLIPAAFVTSAAVGQNTQAQAVGEVLPTTLQALAVGANAQAQSMAAPAVTVEGAESYAPQTACLDDFNRADENPLRVDWWGGSFGPTYGAWKVVDNKAVPVG